MFIRDEFTKEELLTILESVKDKNIIEKINANVFVNQQLVDRIIEVFKDENLLKIEKSDNKNEYFIHLLRESELFDAIKESIKISNEFETNNTEPEIRIITHDDISKMWFHSNMIQVWTRQDVEEYWRNKNSN